MRIGIGMALPGQQNKKFDFLLSAYRENGTTLSFAVTSSNSASRG